MIELKKKYTYKQIGEMYGISEGAVFKRIKHYFEPREKKPKGTKEKPPITKSKNSNRIICNDSVLAEMAALKDRGLSNKEIGQRYGMDPEAIRVKIYRYKKKIHVKNEVNYDKGRVS